MFFFQNKTNQRYIKKTKQHNKNKTKLFQLLNVLLENIVMLVYNLVHIE